jgi:hypothetical protein
LSGPEPLIGRGGKLIPFPSQQRKDGEEETEAESTELLPEPAEEVARNFDPTRTMTSTAVTHPPKGEDVLHRQFFADGDEGRYEGGHASLPPEHEPIIEEGEERVIVRTPEQDARRARNMRVVAITLGLVLAMLLVGLFNALRSDQRPLPLRSAPVPVAEEQGLPTIPAAGRLEPPEPAPVPPPPPVEEAVSDEPTPEVATPEEPAPRLEETPAPEPPPRRPRAVVPTPAPPAIAPRPAAPRPAVPVPAPRPTPPPPPALAPPSPPRAGEAPPTAAFPVE